MSITAGVGSRLLTGVAIVLGITTLGGCTSGGNYDNVELQPGLAVVDPSTETIQFPTTNYTLSLSESRTINYAVDLLVAACVEEKGLEVEPIDRRALGDEGAADASMGLWSMERASRWGYGDVPPSPLMQELLDKNAGFEDDAVQSAWTACLTTVTEQKTFDLGAVTGENDLTTRGRRETWDAVRNLPEWKSVIDDWTSCVKKAGLTPDAEAVGQIASTEEMTQEQQIQTAVADVKCKEETDFIQRLADIRASFEARFVKDNQAALEEQRTTLEEMIADAENVINKHG